MLDISLETLKSLLEQSQQLRAICIENMYYEFKSKSSNLEHLDYLAETLVEINGAIRYYKQKILEKECCENDN